jgi:hypothetical protein
MRLSADDAPRSWEQRNVIPSSGLRSNVPKTPTHGKVGLNLTQKRDNYNAAGRMKNNGCSGLRRDSRRFSLQPLIIQSYVGRQPIAKWVFLTKTAKGQFVSKLGSGLV